MIVIADTELEGALKSLLQQNLAFMIRDKRWKYGRLLLFRQSGFYIEFIMAGKRRSHEKFEVPIPFGIQQPRVDVMVFDYRIDTLAGDSNSFLSKYFRLLKPIGRSKFYDNTIRILIGV